MSCFPLCAEHRTKNILSGACLMSFSISTKTYILSLVSSCSIFFVLGDDTLESIYFSFFFYLDVVSFWFSLSYDFSSCENEELAYVTTRSSSENEYGARATPSTHKV